MALSRPGRGRHRPTGRLRALLSTDAGLAWETRGTDMDTPQIVNSPATPSHRSNGRPKRQAQKPQTTAASVCPQHPFIRTADLANPHTVPPIFTDPSLALSREARIPTRILTTTMAASPASLEEWRNRLFHVTEVMTLTEQEYCPLSSTDPPTSNLESNQRLLFLFFFNPVS